MEFTTMRYNREELYTCAEMVKKYIADGKLHKARKNEMFSRACELKKCYEYAATHLNSALFDPDFGHMKEFLNAAYSFKNYKKCEIEQKEKIALRFICNELNEILHMVNHEPELYEE